MKHFILNHINKHELLQRLRSTTLVRPAIRLWLTSVQLLKQLIFC